MTRLYSISATEPSSIIHFDWMTLVFPIGQTDADRNGHTVYEQIHKILDDLYLGDLFYVSMQNGLYHYDHAEVTGNSSIIIAWYETDGLGKLPDAHCNFMLQCSGAGIETLETILEKNGLVMADFVKISCLYGATFSRVDPCCNFFNYPKEYSARYTGEQAKKGNLVTRASSIRVIHSFSAEGGKDDLDAYQGASEGYTTYIGKNPKQLRIYNKLAERSEKVNLLYQVKSWSRWEFQLNGKQAQAFMNAYIKSNYDLVQTWIDWLYSNYRWINRRGVPHQVKRSRYPNASWFDDLIKNAKNKIRVRTEQQKPTFEKQEKWIDRQVMRTLATMYYARVKKYIENGVTEVDAENLALLKLKNDIKKQAIDQNIDWKQVSTYVKEADIK